MRNKVFSKLVSLAVCACMMGPWQVPAAAFAQQADGAPADAVAASEEAGSTDEVVAPDYQRQYLTDLYADGKVQVSNASATVAVDDASNTLVFSGKRKALTSATISIDKTFDFSNAAVGRFSVGGLAQSTKRVDLAFYLDDQEDPFFTTQLKSQQDEGDWTQLEENSDNVLPLNITGQHTLSIKVSASSASASFALGYIEFAESSVPVLNLDIDESLGTIADMNMSSDHSVNCYGTVSIDVPQGYTSPVTGEALKGTSGALDLSYIRGRGNSTWQNEVKKPYKLKLENSTGLLGMGKSKNWALMANSMDKTEMRNLMTSILGKEQGSAFTVSMEPVEVIMNGQYLGSYMLSENVRQEKTRVNIADLDETPDATDEDTISGGYLLSLGNWTLDSDRLHFTTEHAQGVFQVESPDLYTSKNTAQFNYIKNYVQSVEDAIYEQGDYASLMDVESAARYFWFEELSGNGDGYTSGSCYLYKDRGGKLCWGPLWDFDIAWGNSDVNTNYQGAKRWAQTENFWNKELFKDQSYVDAVKAQWPSFKEALEQLAADGGTLDKLADAMRVAVAYNNEHWDIKDSGSNDDEEEEESEGGEDVPSSATLEEGAACFDNAVSFLRSWLQVRVNWVDENLSSLDVQPVTVTFEDGNGKVLETKTYCLGHTFGELPEAPAKSGYVFSGWQTTTVTTLEDRLKKFNMTEEEYRESLIEGDGMTAEEADAEIAKYKKGVESTEPVDGDSVVLKADQVLVAAYTKISTITPVTKIYSPFKTYYCVYDPKQDFCLVKIPVQAEPFEPTNNRIKITVDNTGVLARTEESDTTETSCFSLLVKGPGDANVTFTPLVGEPATVKVHVYSKEEYEEQGISDAVFSFAKSNITVTEGCYAEIPFQEPDEGAVNCNIPDFTSTNEGIVSVGASGVVYGKKAGTASVCYGNNGSFCCCNVTVVSAAPTVGDTVTVKGLKYRVTSAKKGSCTVSCIGATNKNAKTVSVPKTVKVKSVSCKVTSVGVNAFKGMAKLKKATLAANVEIIGAGAFANCKALRKVVLKSTNKPKIYASAFKNVSSKCKFSVPKSQRKYYAFILKGRVS